MTEIKKTIPFHLYDVLMRCAIDAKDRRGWANALAAVDTDLQLTVLKRNRDLRSEAAFEEMHMADRLIGMHEYVAARQGSRLKLRLNKLKIFGR